MRILHFSDFHLRPGDEIRKSQQLLNNMLPTLEVVNNEKSIDLIIFSGDMVDKGGIGFDSIDLAFGIFKSLISDKIINTLNLTQERLIFVPGNHDIQRSLVDPFTEKGLIDELNSIKKVDEFIHNSNNNKYTNRVNAFKAFQENYYKDIQNANYYHTQYQSNLILDINGKKIGITMMNSVWRCNENDKGNILIGKAQIIDSIEYLKNCDVKIAVSHHDFSWVKEFEFKELRQLVSKYYNLFFCGHTHGADFELNCRPDGNTFYCTAPGLLRANVNELDGNFKNGFSIIDYDNVCQTIAASKYMQNFDDSFTIDKNYGDMGIWEAEIPKGEVALRNKRIEDTYNHICDIIPNLNSHLIGYKTTTKAPKDIESLFIMPNLLYKEQNENSVDGIKENKISSIQELLNFEGNIIIYGDKESGKTILLDKILIEISKQDKINNLIPALLSFYDIKDKIEQQLCSYWDLRSEDTRFILNEKKVILLVDNIDFYEEIKINVIKEFLNSYPNVKLIGTSLGRNAISASGTLEQVIPSTKNFQIDSFKAEQIRELASKWYNVKKDDNCLRETLDFVIKAFNTFKLPCTPFSVTLLLWILEKGGQIQPNNSAILLDSFMKEILNDRTNGFGKENFNQLNKIRLLAAIAHKMLQAEIDSNTKNEPYNFTLGDLTVFVEKHLESMEWKNSFKPQTIIKNLIETGILEQPTGTNKVFFRFRCFMEYFLAQQMSISEDFFNYVLNESNYLDFANVINYFTGLSRDKYSVLNNIISRLEIQFIDLKNILGESKSFDDVFIQKSILETINNPEIEYLSPRKHSTEEDDERANMVLQHNQLCVQNGEKRRKHVSSFRVYSELLVLAMNVLKNTEETNGESGFKMKWPENENISKAECFKIILENSIYYAVVFYIMCMHFIKKNEDDPSKESAIKEASIIMYLLPVLHEELLRDHLGSIKLKSPILEKLQQDKESCESEFQKFMTVFLYGDLKESGYMEYIKSFIIESKRSFIKDACFFKLQQYYYDSNNSKLDKDIVDIIANLYISLKKKSNSQERLNKSIIIEKFKREKNLISLRQRS